MVFFYKEKKSKNQVDSVYFGAAIIICLNVSLCFLKFPTDQGVTVIAMQLTGKEFGLNHQSSTSP